MQCWPRQPSSFLNTTVFLLPAARTRSGQRNAVRRVGQLEFSARSRWTVWAQINPTTSLRLATPTLRVKTEVAATQFIKAHSDLAVPSVVVYRLDENNRRQLRTC